MGHHSFADTALARRVERAIADDVFAGVEDARAGGLCPRAAGLRVAGGVAGFYFAESAMNGAFGLGMSGPVEAEDVAALVTFLEGRGVSASIGVCPHADPSLLRWLAEGGFLVTGFENVSYLALRPGVGEIVAHRWSDRVRADASDVTVRVARTDQERLLWAHLEACGFSDGAPSETDIRISREIARRIDAVHLTGYLDEEPAGTAMMTFSDGVALLNGDSTLPAFRCRGVQSALVAERLRIAAATGCDLAVIEAAPGSVSAKNQARAGFQIAYTRVSLERPYGGALAVPSR